MVLIPSLIAFSSASGNSGQAFSVNALSYGWGSNGTYNTTVLLYNNYGTPVPGAAVTYTIGQNNKTIDTNGMGFANATFHGITDQELGIASSSQKSGASLPFSYEYSSSIGPIASRMPIYQNQTDPYFTNNTFQTYSPNGTMNSTLSFSRYLFEFVSVRNSPRLNGLVLAYDAAGVPGEKLTTYLYYKPATNSTGVFGTGSVSYENGIQQSPPPGASGGYTEKEMTFYGAYSNSPLIDILPTNLTANPKTTTYWFELFTSNGTELAFALIQLVNNYSQGAVGNLFFTTELPLLVTFVPLMAVLSAYQSFGKDRANGALASVIVRPISRKGLMTSRFTSNVFSVMVASAVAMGVSSLIYHYYLGDYIPEGALAIALWSILVMTGSFVGLVYLASVFLKSSGQIIGVSIGLFFAFGLLWIFPLPLIPLLVAAFIIKGPVGSLAYASSLAKLNFFSPASLAFLASFLSGVTPSSIISVGNYTASQLGINTASVIVAGVVWMMAPFALALVKFMRSD